MIAQVMASHDWDPEDGPWDGDLDWDDPSSITLEQQQQLLDVVGNRMFGSIGFGKKLRASDQPAHPIDIFLRCHDVDGPRLPSEKKSLVEHPIARRSMATFPLLKRLQFRYDGFSPTHLMEDELLGSEGITVQHVAALVRSRLDNDSTVAELINCLQGPFSEIAPKEPLLFCTQLKAFMTMRGLWAKCRWDGIELDEVGGNGAVMRFALSPLPEDLYKVEFAEEFDPRSWHWDGDMLLEQ